MRAFLAAVGALGAALAAPALAVGLSPLRKETVTAGPVQAFWLTVINPYDTPRQYRAYVEDAGSEVARPVKMLPERLAIRAGGQRRMLVMVQGLEPGETRSTRVCAELVKQEGMIHARVCSTLVARRLAPRG